MPDTSEKVPFWVDGYVPPIAIGTRVIATAAAEIAPPGTLGTVTWHHPAPTMPYRVKWDREYDGPHFGMSDIGDLTKPDEIEVEPAIFKAPPRPRHA